MKKIIFGLTVLFISVVFVQAEVITSLAGDIDSFGTGKVAGSPVAFSEIVHELEDGIFDQRLAYNPATWQHIFDFSIALDDIISVQLKLETLDIEDNGEGDGLGGEPFDDLLFLDGVELPQAFDDVYTADNTGGQVKPNTVIFELSKDFYPLLVDGLLEVTVDPYGGSNAESIAIDYSELTITYVPEPASLLLFGIGGLILRKRN